MAAILENQQIAITSEQLQIFFIGISSKDAWHNIVFFI
jgi:hypothetical protein